MSTVHSTPLKRRHRYALPRLIYGDIFSDDRGSVRFVNSFHFSCIKRFYQINNRSIKTIRAFHGHEFEEKFIYVANGSILLCAVYLDSLTAPSRKQRVFRYILSADTPTILHIPSQYANGFKTLKPKTTVLVFSTCSLAESKKDDYRYPYDYWGKTIWVVKNKI
ncbi:MAG: dTDP-4-dehydrorhamnose 3,5-epimerase family protein [Candidatus Gottesmanbacteria bacterium]